MKPKVAFFVQGDDLRFNVALEGKLTNHGLQVFPLHNVEEVSNFLALSPKLIILDFVRVGVEGLELLGKMKIKGSTTVCVLGAGGVLHDQPNWYFIKKNEMLDKTLSEIIGRALKLRTDNGVDRVLTWRQRIISFFSL